MRLGPRILVPALLLTACLPTITAIDSGPLSLDSPCQPFDGVDPCSMYGYVCVQDPTGTTTTCQYAEFEDPCLPSVGCDPDAGSLTCLDFTADGGRQALVTFCGTLCNEPTDCLEATASCFTDVYLPDGGLVGACSTNPCDTAYSPCDVGPGSPQGTCLPIDQYGDNVCVQSGPLGLDAVCGGVPAIDAGAYLCQQGEECIFGPDGGTACIALCAGSYSCPAGGPTCVSGYDVCLTLCGSNPGVCSSPFTCQELILGDGTTSDYCTLP